MECDPLYGNIDLDLLEAEGKYAYLRTMLQASKIRYEEAKHDHSEASRRLKVLRKLKINQEYKVNIETRNLESAWIRRKFQWSDTITKLLKDVFKFHEFHPKQLAAINATLSKKDVLVLMPAGGGKSLVYQLTALVDEGLTLVISPSESLIENQLTALKKFGIEAATIHHKTSEEESEKIYEQMNSPESSLKLLYVTPKWVKESKRFLSVLKKVYDAGIIARVAIDEVHCWSTWGHDFRPDYVFLRILRTTLDKTPFIGLTATATSSVLVDIQSILRFENCIIVTAPLNRPNLYYEVVTKFSTVEENVDYLEKILKGKYRDESGIIYTKNVKECIELTTGLKAKNLRVALYHEQLDLDMRKRIHKRWLQGIYQALIATVDLGIGIDNPDVRFLILSTIPKSMESLYQVSGRAGRDRRKADCIIMFSLHDFLKLFGMASCEIERKRAFSVLEYCLDQRSCRRALLGTHFRETWDKSRCNRMCDNCSVENVRFDLHNITDACVHFHDIITRANSFDKKLSLNKLLGLWFQPDQRELRIGTFKKPTLSRKQAEVIVAHLILQKYLKITKAYDIHSKLYCYIQKGRSVGSERIKMTSRRVLSGILKLVNTEKDCDDGPSKKKVKIADML